MLSEEEGKLLISFARQCISSRFSRVEPDLSKVSRFSLRQGAFVTLLKHGKLRGCIGFPEPCLPLKDAIQQASQAAAFEDPRFPPLREEELGAIKLEISVLTVPQEVPKEGLPDSICIGKDGLIIRKGSCSGLLLPQVFTEYDASSKQALEMTCQKAGLPPGAWWDGCTIYKFQAQIFHEN